MSNSLFFVLGAMFGVFASFGMVIIAMLAGKKVERVVEELQGVTIRNTKQRGAIVYPRDYKAKLDAEKRAEQEGVINDDEAVEI